MTPRYNVFEVEAFFVCVCVWVGGGGVLVGVCVEGFQGRLIIEASWCLIVILETRIKESWKKIKTMTK